MRNYLWIPLVVLCFVSCKSKSSTGVQSGDRPLVFARGGDTVSFDPAGVEEGESANILINIFENLVQFKTGSSEIEPGLAESWTVSKDGLMYTFILRKNIQFTDGTPFNADAVIFGTERQTNKNHPGYESGAPYKYWEAMDMEHIVKRVEKVDDYSVRFVLHKPNAPFLANLAMFFMAIPSPTAVLKSGKKFGSEPVGTGPYKLKSWKKDDALELEANDQYWGQKPSIRRVIVRVIPDNQVRLLELKRGSVHIMEFPNPADIPEIEKNSDIRVLKQAGLNFGYFVFNTKKPPLNRPEVRRALSMAIDRERLLKEIFQGLGSIAISPLPPTVVGSTPNVPPVPYDVEGAKKLLEKAGVKALKLDLWAMPVPRPYNPNGRKSAEFIQSDLKRIGVETKIVSYDWGTYLDKLGNGEHELAMIGWNGDNGDADNFLFPLFSKDAALKKPTQNYSYYADDQVTAWLKNAQGATDLNMRKSLYAKVLNKMMTDLPVLPLAYSEVLVPTRADVENYFIQPTGDRRFATVKWRQ